MVLQAILAAGSSRTERVVTLMAALELVRRRELRAKQTSLFGPIVLEPLERPAHDRSSRPAEPADRPGGCPGGHPVRRRSAPDHDRPGRAGRRSSRAVAEGLAALADALEGRGLRLQQLDGSWQLTTAPAVADRVRRYAERAEGA